MFDVFPGLSLESVKHKVVKLIHQLDIDTNCLTYYNLSILLLHAKMYHSCIVLYFTYQQSMPINASGRLHVLSYFSSQWCRNLS